MTYCKERYMEYNPKVQGSVVQGSVDTCTRQAECVSCRETTCRQWGLDFTVLVCMHASTISINRIFFWPYLTPRLNSVMTKQLPNIVQGIHSHFVFSVYFANNNWSQWKQCSASLKGRAIFRSHLPYVMSGCSTPTKALIVFEADRIAGQSLITLSPVFGYWWYVNTEEEGLFIILYVTMSCRRRINTWGTVPNCNNSHFCIGLSILILPYEDFG